MFYYYKSIINQNNIMYEIVKTYLSKYNLRTFDFLVMDFHKYNLRHKIIYNNK